MRNTLFSDYYLAELFPSDTAVEAALAQVGPMRAALLGLFEETQEAVEQASEAELEDILIRPVLRLLGFEYLVQTGLRPARRVPDYLLFATVGDRRLAEGDRAEAPRHAVGLAEAKRWEASLDRGSRGPAFEDRNPSLQIDEYLRASELEWGILTNGRFWRVYNRASSYRLDSFLEIDLPQAMGSDEELAAFVALFSCESYPGPTSNRLLERARAQSLEHAQSLGTSLQSSVYEALRLLSEGLVRAASRERRQVDLSEVRDAAFVLIFRLLFVLYAEARGYLPVDDRAYALSFSLRELAHEIAGRERLLAELSPASTAYWARLRALFRLIEIGSDVAPLLAPYDGGLFAVGRHPLVDELELGDPWVGQAVNRLTRADLPRGRGFVSYRDLGVRELGTVYEALLEQHPFIADTETVVVRQGDALVYRPAAGIRTGVVARYPAGSVLLRTDRGEKRETGTYYTPEPIVRFMVAAAVSRALETRRIDASPVDAVLGMRVLDPAMGSGHFLVEAVDVLARELVAALTGATPGDETEIRWARREVIERCIYGVDVNPLAVELAKLSLWLVTIQSGKPLSFLDHHLRCGNSVVYYPVEAAVEGRRPQAATSATDDLWAGESLGETTSRQLVEAMRLIGDRPTETIRDVAAKREAFALAFERQAGVRKYLDLCTAAVFDRTLERAVQPAFLTLYQGGEWRTGAIDAALATASDIAHQRRFFHWQAEFPEVFYGQHAGFEVVLSNPPYVSAWSMQKSDAPMRRAIPRLPQYGGVAVRHWDLFVPFVSAGLDLLAPGGVMAFILPNPANRELYAENLRARVLAEADMVSLVDFGSANVFDAVSRQSVIWVAQKRRVPTPLEDDQHLVQIVDPDGVQAQPAQSVVRSIVPQGAWRIAPHCQIRANLTPQEASLVARLSGGGVPLSRMLHISYGAQISGSGDDAFARTRYLSSVSDGARNPKRFLEGRDLRPYSSRWAGLFLDYEPGEFYGPRSPSLFEPPKIIVRKISGAGHTLIATADFDGYYLDDGAILGVAERPDVRPLDLLAIAGYLNSSVANFYYQAVFATDSLQGDFSHVYPIAVKSARVPSLPSVDDLLPVAAIHDGTGWASGFDSQEARAEAWATIAAAFSSRLHELATLLCRTSDEFAEYVRHRTGGVLTAAAAEELAAGGLATDDLVARCSAALGRRLRGDELADVRREIDNVMPRLEELRAEASRVDSLLDLAIEDAFRLGDAERRWMHEYLSAAGTARGNRLWDKLGIELG
jgi:TaqI-like C-terminal specificity domain/N-6 DNA Methylase/Eco57I restriction-modification methylase